MESNMETLATSLQKSSDDQKHQNEIESKICTPSSGPADEGPSPGPSGSGNERLHPRVVKAMSKLTGVLKHKVVEYIRLLKQVEEPPSVPEKDDWIYTFINSLCTDVEVTKLDVLIWIKKFPQIFTPQVVRMLRDYCNRIQQIDNENYAQELSNSSDEESELTQDEYYDWALTYGVTQADILAIK